MTDTTSGAGRAAPPGPPADNPFATSGKVVWGDRFVGRGDLLGTVHDRVTGPRHSGNLALIGGPRVGKSSIAQHAVMARRADLLARRTIVLWVGLHTCDTGWELFKRLVGGTCDVVEAQGWLTPALDRPWRRMRKWHDPEGDWRSDVEAFFRQVLAHDVKVIAVLDEFDEARRLWKAQPGAFKTLRKISNDADSSVTFVTTSRRRIDRIETDAVGGSTFANIFQQVYVRPFDAAEAGQFLDRVAAAGVPLEAAAGDVLHRYTGWLPFHLDLVAFGLYNRFGPGRGATPSGGVPADAAEAVCREVSHQFTHEYEQVARMLVEDGRLGRLLQVLFGPVFDVTDEDATWFEQYGLIRSAGPGFVAYSDRFDNYLRSVQRTADVWPLWRDTEKALRRVVGRYLAEHYGDPWEAGALKPWMATFARDCAAKRDAERLRYGMDASDDLLDYSYPGDLIRVVQQDWTWFGRVFPGRPADWDKHFQLLARVRTPLAHNRADRLPRNAITRATGLCEQVLALVGDWERQVGT